MRYQRSLEIEQRLQQSLRLIATGKYSTSALAEAIGVSVPTVSRIIAALRSRGRAIQARRMDDGWRYVLSEEPTRSGSKQSNNQPSEMAS